MSSLLALTFALAAALGTAQDSTPREPEPEQPDFAFISSSAYTQVKQSVQIIHQTGYGTRRSTVPGGQRNADDFLFFSRAEWGLTGRLELDVVTPVRGSRERLNGVTAASEFAYADSLIGLRYQFLSEDTRPLTLTMGPQLILPTGSVERGTGNGSAGFAWDVAASKDWGGPAFLYSTFNYSLLPSASDTTPGSARKFSLQGTEWAAALGLRALERPSNGRKHDVHVFLEAGGGWDQEVEPGLTAGSRRGVLSWVTSAGVRYGFQTPRKTLIEIGVAVPIGLGPNGPKKGILVQFQFEKLFRPGAR